MRRLSRKFWADDSGVIISLEILFIATILVIGLIAGWTALRGGVVFELGAIGNAAAALDEGYQLLGLESQTGSSNSTTVTHATITAAKITVKPASPAVSDDASGQTNSGPPAP